MYWQDNYNKQRDQSYSYRYITNGGCLVGEVYITNGGCLEGELYISNGGCLEGEVEYYTLQLTFNFTSLCNALSFFF